MRFFGVASFRPLAYARALLPDSSGRVRLVALVRRSLAVAALASTCALLAMSSPAQAGSNTYCWGQVFASGATCYGPRHSLRQNWALNYYGASFYVAAAALDQNWNYYGTWVYGIGQVCHSYSGANILYPYMYNADSRTQTMGGVEYWGSEPACP